MIQLPEPVYLDDDASAPLRCRFDQRVDKVGQKTTIKSGTTRDV